MQIIIEQILVLALIAIIGLIAFKLKAITKEHNAGLVKVILKITLPILIFTTFANTNLDKEIIQNFPIVFVSAFISVILLYFLSNISAKILKLDKENKALHNTHTMFGNTIFLGFPLLDALFPGGEGLIYATIFQLAHDSLMWTWGIVIMSKASNKNLEKNNKKHLLNPISLAFAVGLILMIFKIKLPDLILKPLLGVGHTTIYISMIYVGAVLAQAKLKPLIQNLRSYILSFNKLIFAPLVLALILFLVKSLGLNISDTAFICAVLQSAMPCMIIISVLAEDLGLNAKQAVENILVSSVLSIFTLPFIYWVISIF